MEANALQSSTKLAMRKCRNLCEADRKKKVDSFALLHEDLLLEILKKLPPDSLRYKFKFVCKRWFYLITNKILFDHASLILEPQAGCRNLRFMDVSEENDDLKMKEQQVMIPYIGRIKSWCNEFLLITDLNRIGRLYVYNLLTTDGIFLPPCPSSSSCGGHYSCKCGIALSYDEFKGVYKIIHVFLGPPLQCEILVLQNFISLDFPSWKMIKGPIYTGQRKYYWDDPVSVQGRYLHWDVHCHKYLFSMDTVKERFRQTPLPTSDDYPMTKQYSFFEMGGFLALFHMVSDDQVNLWMLKDYQRTKWELMQAISVSSFLRSSLYLGKELPVPVTSVRSKRYIVFKKLGIGTAYYSYDLKRKVMKRLEVEIVPTERCVVQPTAVSYC